MPVRTIERILRLRLYQARRFVIRNVLHADDPPASLALGAAIGVFVAFTPTFGVQMLLVIFFAWLLKANKAIGVPVVWISNPATVVPIFYPCYVIGRVILGLPSIGADWWSALRHPPEGWWAAVQFYWLRLMDIAAPLWLGSIVIGLLTSATTYYVAYHLIRSYRMRRFGKAVVPRKTATTAP